MKPWYRVFIYLFTISWDLISWGIILLIHLFWGENLKWERDENDKGSPCLTTDLKKDSWPTRTWYTYKVNGKKVLIPEHLKERYGTYRTWGGTTLGPHAIFYGPGRREEGKWTKVQEHEHVHSEQGESYMILSFMMNSPYFIYGVVNGIVFAYVVSISFWTLGYVFMVSNFLTAILRGESAYRGSHHEESAYHQEDDYKIQ